MLGILLGSCGDAAQVEGDSIADGPEPAMREVVRELRWESALLEDLGHSLTIVFTGGREGNLEDNPCVDEYDVEILESNDSVIVTLYLLRLVDPPPLPDDLECTDEGYERRLGLTLGGEGLGDRVIIDGANGETRTIIDETAILMPSELPEGWSEWYRHPQDSAMVIAYGPAGGDGLPPLTYLVAPTDNGIFNMDPESLEQDLTTLEATGVRGNDSGAFVITSLEDGSRTFVFEHGGRHHRVTIQSHGEDKVALEFIDGLQ